MRKPSARNFVALGTPIGTAEFVAQETRTRLQEAQRFLDALLDLPDLQCAWLLLLYCASPRAQHLLRTLPPSLSDEKNEYMQLRTMMPFGSPCSGSWANLA